MSETDKPMPTSPSGADPEPAAAPDETTPPDLHDRCFKEGDKFDFSDAGHRKIFYWLVHELLSSSCDNPALGQALIEIRRRWQTGDVWRAVDRATQSLADNQPQILESSAFVVTFPRSGSNFLQNLIGSVVGGDNCSIYAMLSNYSCIQTLKSHAISADCLDEECNRLLGGTHDHRPVILLLRDPIDVIISFYEFTKAKLGVDIDQGDFLEAVDYYLASGIDFGCQRRSALAPQSIKSAYTAHIQSWLTERESINREVLTVHYENLVTQPDIEMANICECLGWPSPPAVDESIQTNLVSLISNEPTRPRGKTHSWTAVQATYEVLIKQTRSLLGDSIHQIAMDRDGAR